MGTEPVCGFNRASKIHCGRIQIEPDHRCGHSITETPAASAGPNRFLVGRSALYCPDSSLDDFQFYVLVNKQVKKLESCAKR